MRGSSIRNRSGKGEEEAAEELEVEELLLLVEDMIEEDGFFREDY